MAANSEITAKLGIDTKSIPRDLEEANGFFKKFSRENAEEGGRAGETYSKKLTDKLAEKLGGSREISHALATAFGLNIEKISDKIAEAIVGGSKEGFKEMERLADETAEAIKQRGLVGKGTGDIIKSNEKERDEAVAELTRLQNQKSFTNSGTDVDTLETTGITSEADKIKAAGLVKTIAVLETEIKKQKLEQADAEKELSKSADERVSKENGYIEDLQKQSEIQKEIEALVLKAANDEAKGFDTLKQRKEIAEKEKQLAETNQRIAEDDKLLQEVITDGQKLAVENQKKIVSETEKEFNLRKDIAALRNKENDKNKLTISELAHLKGSSGGLDLSTSISTTFGGGDDDSGLSQKQKEDKAKARRVLELQGQAEQARQSGDAEGAGAINQQVGALQSELVKGGAVKSTEAPDDNIALEISHSNDLLQKVVKSIDDLKKSKFANE